MFVLNKKKPVKIWLNKESDVESGCMDQIDNLAELPFIHNHVAGRLMGRKEAKRKIKVQDVIEEMKGKNITVGKHKKDDIADESRQAYKDIDIVMKNQKDLVNIMLKLIPIGVVKG